MQSEQWHPSDIENTNGSEPADQAPQQRRRLRAPGSDAEGKIVEQPQPAAGEQLAPVTQPQAPVRRPPTQGVMTLDRDSASRASGMQSEAEQAASQVPEVRVRLREASGRCVTAYEAWQTVPMVRTSCAMGCTSFAAFSRGSRSSLRPTIRKRAP